MPNIQFGTGGAFFVPSNANAPLLTNLSPNSPQLLQEMSVEFKADQKMLFGRKQMASAVARGKVNISGKGKLATFDPVLANQLYFGMPTTTAGTRIQDSELHALNASTSAVITVAPPNAGVFQVDYGVINGVTGIQMIYTSAAPIAENQYSVNLATGAYTFFNGETATSVSISYGYSSTTGSGFTVTAQNMGYGPTFKMTLANTFQGKGLYVTLNSCTLTDYSIPTKQDDFWVSDISFVAQLDPGGTLGTIYADQ